MNGDPIERMSNDELTKCIDQLEGQAWLNDLRGLQPKVEGQALFDLGFAAGKQSVAGARRAMVATARTAIVSSLLSLAGAILVMSQLAPSIIRSSGQRVEVAMDDNGTSQLSESPLRPQSGEAAEYSIEDLLPATVQDPVLSMEIRRDGYDSSEAKIETDRIRYVTQRRGLLTDPTLELTTPFSESANR